MNSESAQWENLRNDARSQDRAVVEAYFRFRAANEYNNSPVSHFWFRQRELILSELAAAHRGRKGTRIIDLGCGDGFLVERVLERLPTAKIVAIDANTQALLIVEAARRYISTADRADVIRASVYETGMPDGSADIVVCSEVVEHLIEDERALREMARLLTPGGTLVIATPNAGNLVSRLARWAGRGADSESPSVRMSESPPPVCSIIDEHVNERAVSYWTARLAAGGFDVKRIQPVALRYGTAATNRSSLRMSAVLALESFLFRLPRAYHFGAGVVITAAR